MITARFGREARGAAGGHALAELAFNPLKLAAFAGLLRKLAVSPSAVDQLAHLFLDFPMSSYAICFVYSPQPVQL
jgi:hypothetical protein